MKEKHIQILGIIISIVYFTFIVWVYAYQPKNLVEVVTKAAVTVGTYSIDQKAFDEGLAYFYKDDFPSARALFEKADPERRDAKTQFYVAYSFYRQGWGRVSNDDTLFLKGLESANRVNALNPGFNSDDQNLKMKTPVELKAEFEQGLEITASDFNPLKIVRERK